mmetsp:Transcript_2874/g.4327  ORF Transcript_2874/g.4327 Transcript_2874/m.4327 type:complete len:305 (-) Transcript_2874:25-939(-)
MDPIAVGVTNFECYLKDCGLCIAKKVVADISPKHINRFLVKNLFKDDKSKMKLILIINMIKGQEFSPVFSIVAVSSDIDQNFGKIPNQITPMDDLCLKMKVTMKISEMPQAFIDHFKWISVIPSTVVEGGIEIITPRILKIMKLNSLDLFDLSAVLINYDTAESSKKSINLFLEIGEDKNFHSLSLFPASKVNNSPSFTCPNFTPKSYLYEDCKYNISYSTRKVLAITDDPDAVNRMSAKFAEKIYFEKTDEPKCKKRSWDGIERPNSKRFKSFFSLSGKCYVHDTNDNDSKEHEFGRSPLVGF